MSAGPVRETDLAGPAIRHLEAGGYEVHQEVAPYGGGWARADLCGVLSLPSGARVTHVVELKTSFSTEVVDQALHWVGYSHYVTICTPRRRKGSPSRALIRLCRDEGIGHLTIAGLEAGDHGGASGYEYQPPKLHRSVLASRLLACLNDETRKGVARAGSQDRFSTPFSRTFDATIAFIGRAKKPVTIREVVDGVTHHYSNDQCARSSLVKWLTGKPGEKKGIKATHDGRSWRFYLDPLVAS